MPRLVRRLSDSQKVNALLAHQADGLLQSGTLGIDATPEKFKTNAILVWRRKGIQFTKAATSALVLTAAHPVTASKCGVILYQIDDAGVITSKVPGATQTTTQAYATAQAALDAKPAVTDGCTEIGHSIITADSGGWTALTDDMTNGSDLVTATFVNAPVKQSLPAVS
jgi:hypothetical protein